jgi:hypothetical protein
MTLMRAAFETDSNVVLFTVLCAGCFQVAQEKREGHRCWTRPIRSRGVECEFCSDEIRQAL